jgi:hypothetical protein
MPKTQAFSRTLVPFAWRITQMLPAKIKTMIKGTSSKSTGHSPGGCVTSCMRTVSLATCCPVLPNSVGAVDSYGPLPAIHE